MGFGDYFNLNKALNQKQKSWTNTTSRPSISQPYMATDTGAKLPIFPYPLTMIYELSDNVDALRIPIEALNREMFKNDFEVKEKFKWKCNDCAKEFDYAPLKEESDGMGGGMEPGKGPDANMANTSSTEKATKKKKPAKKPDEKRYTTWGGPQTRDSGEWTFRQEKDIEDGDLQCDTCGGEHIVRPVPQNRKVLKSLYEEFVNNNRQTIYDVLRQLERDFEVADSAYMLLLKNYNIDDSTGKINEKKTEIKEILRLDPPQVAMIADSDARIGYDDKRLPVFVCPRFEHRDKRLTKPVCERCGCEAIRAVAEVSSVYSIGIPQPKRVIYGEGEILWKAGKYKPGLIYGYSPIYSMWSKVMSLSHMDEYIRKYFDKMRPPKGLLVIASRNYETFRKSWNALEQRAIEDPYMIHPLMVESEKGGRNMAQWLDFTGSLRDLEFVEIRRELRQIIAASYGILPLYYGELPSGWNQEGLQVTISNRMVTWSQDFLAKAFMDPLAKELGVDDWVLRLKAGEETDKLRQIQTEGVEIDNMVKLQGAGFEIERAHNGEWKVSKKPTFEQMPPQPMVGEPGGPSKPVGDKGRGRGTASPKSETQPSQGAPKHTTDTSPGGKGQGHPASGPKSQGSNNQSQKAAYVADNDKLFMPDTLNANDEKTVNTPEATYTEPGDNQELTDDSRTSSGQGSKGDKVKKRNRKHRIKRIDSDTVEVEDVE